MTNNIIFIVMLLTIVYGALIYLIIKNIDFKNKIILSISVLIFFVITQFYFFNNLGYPTTEKLPNKFHLLHVYKSDNKFIILIKNTRNNEEPRVYKLNYSKQLDKILNEATTNINNGHNIIGIIDNNKNDNYYGIAFKKIKKQLPLK
ncbi:MAG: hypothetical protein H8E55_16330 [Pelagibacterales bacterium]|nr:hypothetical protein [Pelagibacterales bacterium]